MPQDHLAQQQNRDRQRAIQGQLDPVRGPSLVDLGGLLESGGQVLAALLERDRRDSTRAVAPLRVAADASEVDTSGMTLDEVVDAVAGLVGTKVGGGVSGEGS